MTEPIVTGITTLEELAAALKVRRQKLGMSQWLVDDIAGMVKCHTHKIETGKKGLGKITVPLLLGALKCELALMPAARQHREKTEDFWTRRGRSLRAKQALMQSPKERRKIARAAAKARWRKAGQVQP